MCVCVLLATFPGCRSDEAASVPLCEGGLSIIAGFCLFIYFYLPGVIPHSGGRSAIGKERIMLFMAVSFNIWIRKLIQFPTFLDEDFLSSALLISIARLRGDLDQLCFLLEDENT